ncbi:aminotransferase class III-fold pyridoxal phosphate-dependent enzyme [Pseudohaliea sp.]|uniref:aminotransferase class III-fold pyridoxal phosphate-dependent enzyme n=1 Tax=Pseudohaliea sp. TaxID=2740289 RepID=UPI0032EE77AA
MSDPNITTELLWHPSTHPNRRLQTQGPLNIVRGSGVYVTDAAGKQYLDANAGGLWCVNVGHDHPKVKEAISKQLDELAFFQIWNGVSHPPAEALARKLIEVTVPEGMARVFFTSGGSDSTEQAMKLARQFHLINGEESRKRYISLKRAYHGVHGGCLSVAGQKVFNHLYGPVQQGNISIDPPWLYRNQWSSEDPEQLVGYSIQQLKAEIEYHGPETIAALIAEPIIANMMIIPPESFWPRLREVCDEYGILLIADEIVCGFGRTGEMFGSRLWDTAPDFMCMAKGLSSAYVPLGAVAVGKRVADIWERNESPDGMIYSALTYAGHPLACAAAKAAIEVVEEEGLAENAALQGNYLLNKLKRFESEFPCVGDVRGRGLMLAIDLVADKATREPVDPGSEGSIGLPALISIKAREHGLLVRPLGSMIILSPALVYSQEHCDELASILSRSIGEALQAMKD